MRRDSGNPSCTCSSPPIMRQSIRPASGQGVKLRLGEVRPLLPYQFHRPGPGVGIVVGQALQPQPLRLQPGGQQGLPAGGEPGVDEPGSPLQVPSSLRRAMSAGRASFRRRNASFFVIARPPFHLGAIVSRPTPRCPPSQRRTNPAGSGLHLTRKSGLTVAGRRSPEGTAACMSKGCPGALCRSGLHVQHSHGGGHFVGGVHPSPRR